MARLAVIRYSTAWTASLRKLSGSLDLNAAMPSATLCAPKCFVEVRQLGVCVRRVLRSETVFHGAMDSDRGLELALLRIAKCAIAPFCHFLR